MSLATHKERRQFRDLTEHEGHCLFDRHARATLGVSGEEFIRRWKAGEYDNDPENRDVIRLVMLLPLTR